MATWSIPSSLRSKTIAPFILKMRAALEDDFRRQLAALGIRDDGVHPPARPPSAADERARAMALAVIERDVEGGAAHSEALGAYVQECAFTLLNRAFALRCLDERGLLVVDGQTETVFKIDPARNASSLYWRVRNQLGASTAPRDVWREAYRRACSAISQRVRVLFDPEAEHAVLFPLQDTMQRLADGLNAPEVPESAYSEDEILGWVYQYYNQAEKDAVYERLGRGEKIERPEELAAASCLYTERYMVDYLLQNTLGAAWVERHAASDLPHRWPYYVRPPGPASPPVGDGVVVVASPLAREGEGGGERLADTVPVEARRVRDITLLDPCVGSGHFLVRAFDLLVDMYREEGVEEADEIPQLILERNLYGIDIDPRAAHIAALALYLKGCGIAGPDFRPRRLNLVAADVTLPATGPAPAYMRRFSGDPETTEMVDGVWRGLQNAAELGSLLHPERAIDEVVQRKRQRERGGLWEHDDLSWERWATDLLEGLRQEFERQAESEDLGQRLFGVEAAKGVTLVEALGRRYDVVVTNPPYAGSGNLNAQMKQFLERGYKEGKRDLYAAFIQRCRDFARRDGRVGMVTQQSWLFLRSFAALRKTILEGTTVATLAHLGPAAFEEISGEVVNVALFTLRAASPPPEHRLTAFRLIGPKSPTEKEALLRRAISGTAAAVVSTPRQADFLAIPETPFVYWLRPRFFELLGARPKVSEFGAAVRGLNTNDDSRFLRFFWETTSNDQEKWVPYCKGGGYARWQGLDHYVAKWENSGQEIKSTGRAIIPSQHLYFRWGFTYTDVARGSLGCREISDRHIMGDKGPGVFPPRNGLHEIGFLNSHLATFLLRSISPSLQFRTGYVNLLPLLAARLEAAGPLVEDCLMLKRNLLSPHVLERAFTALPGEAASSGALTTLSRIEAGRADEQAAALHSLEGMINGLVCAAYELGREDWQSVLDETGTPAGHHALIGGYDAAPLERRVLPSFDSDHYTSLQRLWPSASDEALLRARLRMLYQGGPGASLDVGAPEPESVDNDDGDEQFVLGARIPIPAETFLEELSQKLEIHPISVYWLLEEMREQEGLVCPPEIKRQMEDYASVTILRLLGYRWPEQDAYETEHGPIMDPTLIDPDGIIPLVRCGDEPTAEQRVRTRLERDFGEEGAAKSLAEFRQWVGRDVGDWLKREFFRRHVQQFKQRPITWHFVSREKTFEAFVLYHRLSRATLQKLRAQYAGGLIKRLREDQERARQEKNESRVRDLELQIEDVEEFRQRIEAIERGDELKYRIRCRWKGEEETGRPGPYAPDIDDGVKVNIRPFQEAELLAVKKVINKW